MIDKKIEEYYDTLFSVILGVVVVTIIYSFYDCPKTIIVENIENNNTND